MENQPKRYGFSRRRRIKRPADFDAVFKAKQSVADHHLVVYARPNRLGFSRLGLGVGRKLGSAVRRNRYKRSMREAFRLMVPELPAGYDYVLIPRRTAGPKTHLYQRSLLELTRRWQKRYRSQ